jgi:AcrR family transcriptional regulator
MTVAADMSTQSAEVRPDLRKRRRAATQLDIAEAAEALFAERGYDAVTVRDIADAAGISLRTFYRYCTGKEDAIAALVSTTAHQTVESIRSRPLAEPLDVAVAAAFAHTVARNDIERIRRLLRVMFSEPALLARWVASSREAQSLLTPVVAARTGVPPDALRAKVTAALLITALDAAVEHWAGFHDDRPAGLVAEEALAILRDGLRAIAPAGPH